MSGLLFQITSSAFFLFLIFNAISWLKIWEDREFKWERVVIYLRETKQGKGLLFGYVSLIKWILILGYSVTIVSSEFDYYYHLSIFALYVFLSFRTILRIYSREFTFPSFPYTFLFILVLTVAFELTLFAFSPLDRFLWMLIIDRLLPLIIAFFVLILYVFFDFNTDIIINKALRKIKNLRNLLVIAVVGSYGKGTTKEFISKILSAKFNVVATKTSFNTALRIAENMLKDFSPNKQIFVAEMEDYRFGDIAEMCNIARPAIAVVTGINDQNISMFGTMDRVLSSKFEAVESLPRDGIAIFNGNNSYSKSLYERTERKKFIYATDETAIEKPDIFAFNIKENKFSTSFNIKVFGKTYKISNLKLLGRQSIENLLPAIFIGLYIGMDFSLIRKALRDLTPLSGTMNPKITKNKAVLIDDTYNANFNSVVYAVEYIKIYRGRKILIFEPLLELGDKAEQDHILLGEKIGSICDVLILTNKNYMGPINRGIKKSHGKCEVMVLSPVKISSFVKQQCKKEDVAAFVGRGARPALTLVPSEPVYTA